MKLMHMISKIVGRDNDQNNDSVVIIPGQNLSSNNTLTEENSFKERYLWKITVFLVILMLVICLAIVTSRKNESSKKSESQTNSFCSGEFGGDAGKQAADLLGQDKSEELAKVVEKILSSNYSENMSCLVILTTHYINVYDKGNTQKFLEMLLQLNPPNIIFVGDKQIVMSDISAKSELLNAQLNKKQIIGGVDE